MSILVQLWKYLFLSDSAAFIILLAHVFYVLYEEVKVKKVVEEIFEQNNYTDISLSVCHEEACSYDFGKGKEHIKIYTVGRENIENRINLARDVAKHWPQKNHLCLSINNGNCQL